MMKESAPTSLLLSNPDFSTVEVPGLTLHRENREELDGFETRLAPLKERLYRTAMILTKSPGAAETLLKETCRQARHLYAGSRPKNYFGYWISHILLRNFTRRSF
jgi:DNA-directed RNA polymerase specialized sigma24 family protein